MNVGFIWRSQAVLPLNSELLANGTKVANASTHLSLPESFEGGLAYGLLRDAHHTWKLEGDLHYIRWSRFRDLDVRLSDGALLPNPQDWHDAITVALGTEFKWRSPPAPPTGQSPPAPAIYTPRRRSRIVISIRPLRMPIAIPSRWAPAWPVTGRGDLSGSSRAPAAQGGSWCERPLWWT